ncbi:MAG: hypothetical protein ACR2FG_15535 [Marmoricola sp.]
MRARVLLGTAATVALLATGCGSRGATGAQPDTSDHASASAKDMSMNMGTGDRPSDPAKMICGAEIQDAVRRTFALSGNPSSVHSWSKSDRVYSCTYRLPHGKLAMSVQDSLDEKSGRAYFDALRKRLPGARVISGMESYGFPAFETSDGNVVFLKDGKTLRVDATSLPSAALPKGFSREEAAFSVASAVIACWSE